MFIPNKRGIDLETKLLKVRHMSRLKLFTLVYHTPFRNRPFWTCVVFAWEQAIISCGTLTLVFFTLFWYHVRICSTCKPHLVSFWTTFWMFWWLEQFNHQLCLVCIAIQPTTNTSPILVHTHNLYDNWTCHQGVHWYKVSAPILVHDLLWTPKFRSIVDIILYMLHTHVSHTIT